MLLSLSGCEQFDRQRRTEVPAVAASSPYLAAAVGDLRGPAEPVLLLAAPGQCPGHFDLRPEQVQDLREARVLFRFDFQDRLDRGLNSAVEAGLRIEAVEPPAGLGLPTTYEAVCGQVADVLVARGLMVPAAAEHRLAAIRERIRTLGEAMRRDVRAAEVADVPVAVDRHQAMFCRSVGLKVVMDLTRSENPRTFARTVEACRSRGVRLVVGNAPQGAAWPGKLAGRIGAEVVMLANFPDLSDGDMREPAFDAMVRSNVGRLIEAARR